MLQGAALAVPEGGAAVLDGAAALRVVVASYSCSNEEFSPGLIRNAAWSISNGSDTTAAVIVADCNSCDMLVHHCIVQRDGLQQQYGCHLGAAAVLKALASCTVTVWCMSAVLVLQLCSTQHTGGMCWHSRRQLAMGC